MLRLMHWAGTQEIWVRCPALPQTPWVILAKSLQLSGLRLPESVTGIITCSLSMNNEGSAEVFSCNCDMDNSSGCFLCLCSHLPQVLSGLLKFICVSHLHFLCCSVLSLTPPSLSHAQMLYLISLPGLWQPSFLTCPLFPAV